MTCLDIALLVIAILILVFQARKNPIDPFYTSFTMTPRSALFALMVTILINRPVVIVIVIVLIATILLLLLLEMYLSK